MTIYCRLTKNDKSLSAVRNPIKANYKFLNKWPVQLSHLNIGKYLLKQTKISAN